MNDVSNKRILRKPAGHCFAAYFSAFALIAAIVPSICGCGPKQSDETPAVSTAEPIDSAGTVPAARTPPSPPRGPIVFRDVTAESGIDFRHFDGSSGRRYIVEYVAGGVALLDYNNDGLLDIYLLNGARLPGSDPEETPRNRLYRNDGNWRFTDVTDEAGVGDEGHGLGVTAADLNNSGFQDLYINNFGGNVLYLNNGDGTFTAAQEQAGVVNGDRVGAGVCCLDINGNGNLDLFVANYVKFSYEDHVPIINRGIPVSPSPLDHEPDSDTLYQNNGDGTFTDISESSGIARHAGTGMGAICFDFDQDGRTDIFVCNDVQANFLYRNEGEGVFREIGLPAGVACDFSGLLQGSMGVDCGDFDRDGRLDMIKTTFEGEMPVLYRNSGEGYFEDVTVQSRIGATTTAAVTWGVAMADFDNDGEADLFMASGHLMDNIDRQDTSRQYASRNFLFRNLGDGTFEDLTDRAGDGLAVVAVSRGTAFGDLDNDGRIDGIVLNSRGPVTLMQNAGENDNHWIQVRLHGTATNRDGVGARVVVECGDEQWVQEVHSGRGYQSHHGMVLHFGLGQHDAVDRITVHWVGGEPEVFRDLQMNRRVTLVEGTAATP